MTDLSNLKDIYKAKNISDLDYEYEETKLELDLNLFQLEERFTLY